MYSSKLRKHLNDFTKSDYLKIGMTDNNGPIVDCSFGVNPFGHPENILIENKGTPIEIGPYPELGAFEFRDELIKYWEAIVKLDYNNLAISDGSMGLINSLNSLFIDVEDRVLGYSPQFPEFVDSLRFHGGIYVPVLLDKEKNYKFSLDEFIAALEWGDYKYIYIDNPNNPTGQIINISDIESIIKRAWELNIIVLIDEAYGDYMTMQNSAISLIHKYNNFYVLKSFSKAYSLAGIRIGYLVGSSELMGLYSLVDDFLINRVALHVALKALNHKDYLKGTINRTRENKNELIGSFNKLKVLETAPEVPIFTVFTENESIDLYKALKDHGIETSSGFYNLGKNSVRIRIPETNATLVQILSNFEKTI